MQQGSAQENSVVDLSAYRSAKGAAKTSDAPETDIDAARIIDEIAHHLLMAIRAIKSFHRDH